MCLECFLVSFMRYWIRVGFGYDDLLPLLELGFDINILYNQIDCGLMETEYGIWHNGQYHEFP